MRPSEATIRTISGSGLFQLEAGCRPASAPVPTVDIGGALVKISASGPIPTSRYWLQAPCLISTSLRCIASGEPGFSFDRSSPMSLPISVRIVAAAAGLPRAFSSITRSSIETAKVTPAAFTACRSSGESNQGRFGSRPSTGVLARMSANEPIASPSAARRAAAGSALSQRSRLVGKLRVTSTTCPPRSVTTAGPPRSGRQTRPASAAASASAGRVVVTARSRLGMAASTGGFGSGAQISRLRRNVQARGRRDSCRAGPRPKADCAGRHRFVIEMSPALHASLRTNDKNRGGARPRKGDIP